MLGDIKSSILSCFALYKPSFEDDFVNHQNDFKRKTLLKLTPYDPLFEVF